MFRKIQRAYPVIVGVLTIASIGIAGFPIFHTQAGQPVSTPLPYPPPQTVMPPLPTSPLLQTPPAPTSIPLPSPETEAALKYVAEKYGIPSEQLVIVQEHHREYRELDRAFLYFALLDSKSLNWYYVMKDLVDGSFVDDIAVIEDTEQKAYQIRYGKLDPALFELLAAMRPADELPVAIWIPGTSNRSEEELFTILAAKYPEVQAALQRSGNPFDVGDYQRINEVEAEYMRMLEEDTLSQTKSLVNYLQKQGYAVTTLGALPAIVVTLPKSLILEVASRADVGAIYLAEAQQKTELDTAVPTNRVPVVWQRGYKGNGIGIAILESGKVDFTGSGPGGSNYLIQGQVRQCNQAEDNHKTKMASDAASSHSVYTGMAPQATILDACTNTSQSDTVDGLSWATGVADPINFSAGFEQTSGNLNFTDKAFDYYARQGNDTVVKSSGDEYGPLTSPGMAWNIITVGATDNKENSNWSDDEWASISGWDTSPTSDREKPEVVAPGAYVTALVIDSNLGGGAVGTSDAAAQVSGLAALVMSRNFDLAAYPMAVKAIIMASAVHNIDGPSNIPTGQDLKDGAGAIDANLADTIAKIRWTSPTSPCNAPCWWGESINNTNFPVGTYLYRYFTASRGERIRVAISWWSNADCASFSSCNFDRLDTKLDLLVLDPDGATIPGGNSASNDNNYELVEFTAPKTGQYKIGVYKASNSETSSNQLGIAWVKDATYLPDLRNKDGWVTTFYVRNDGTLGRNVTINYFDTNGNNPYSYGSDVCYLFPNEWCWIPVNDFNRIPPGTTGSAIVDGGEDVSVLVTNKRSPTASSGAYNGFANAQTSSTFYVPQLMHLKTTASGQGNSRVMIQNIGAASTTVTTRFFDSSGSLTYQRSVSLNPNASDNYDLPNLPAEWIGSAVVSASGGAKIAVTSDITFGSDGLLTNNDFPAEDLGTTWLVPSFLSRLSGLSGTLSTPVNVQNLSGGAIGVNGLRLFCTKNPASPNPVNLDVYNSTAIPNTGTYSFNPVVDATNFPTGWYGSCRLTSGAANVVTIVQMRYVGQANAAAYEAIRSNGADKQAIFPVIQKRLADGSATSVFVQNLNTTSAAHVTFQYIADCPGCSNVTVGPYEIPAGGSLNHNHRLSGYGSGTGYHGLPDGWYGSLVVMSSDQPIHGFNQLTNINNPAGDTYMAHNATTRP